MRYLAKVYISDVMDQIVVSGYVLDADPITDPDHEPVEFTYQTATPVTSDPLEWLQQGLYRWIADMRTPSRVEA